MAASNREFLLQTQGIQTHRDAPRQNRSELRSNDLSCRRRHQFQMNLNRPLYPESELSDTAAFELALTDLFLGPDEGLSFVVICVDVGIDVLLELFEACEGGAAKRLPLQDREPYLDLIEPGRACRVPILNHDSRSKKSGY